MNIPQIHPKLFVAVAFGAALACAALYGCASSPTPSVGASPTTQPAAATAAPAFALFGPPPKKSGVELWSDNCGRCHNIRPPNEFSAAQWDVIVHHMQLRANLTSDEASQIVKFLQASS